VIHVTCDVAQHRPVMIALQCGRERAYTLGPELLAIVALAFNVGCTFFLSSASTDCYVHALERLRLGIVTCLRTNKSLLICTWRSWTLRNASASEIYAYMLALIEALLPGECVLVELMLCISSHGI